MPPKHHPNTRIELGNNDFRNQRTRVNKKSYVAKNQTKMPVGVTFWAPVYLTITESVPFSVYPFIHETLCSRLRVLCYYFQCQIQNGDQIACSRPFTASSFLTLVSYCEISCNIKFLFPFFPIPVVMQMETSYFIRINKNMGRDTRHFEISTTTIFHSTFGRTDGRTDGPPISTPTLAQHAKKYHSRSLRL